MIDFNASSFNNNIILGVLFVCIKILAAKCPASFKWLEVIELNICCREKFDIH